MTFFRADESMQQVGSWSFENGVSFCYPTCPKMVYNSAQGQSDSAPVSDSPPANLVPLTTGVRGMLIFFVVVACVLIIGISVFLYIYREDKLIRSSQPKMLCIILAGALLGAAKVVDGALPVTDATCSAGLWFGHLGFWCVFSALFSKTWRVHRILNGGAFKRVKVTEAHTLTQIGVCIAMVIVYLAVMTAIAHPRQVYVDSVAHNLVTRQYACSLQFSGMHTALFVVEGACLLFGARLCWATKDVPDAVNEAFNIAAGVYLLMIRCIMLIKVLV